jgi:DNA-binding transcriptional MerR regulator
MPEKLIGQVAKEFGLNPRTLRYYETLRLLPRPRRSTGGYRLYDHETERQLAFISRAKNLGLTLREIQRVLAAANGGKVPCQTVARMLSGHVSRIDEQIVRLRSLKSDLRSMLATCPPRSRLNGKTNDQMAACPMIEEFGREVDSQARRRAQ